MKYKMCIVKKAFILKNFNLYNKSKTILELLVKEKLDLMGKAG